MDESTEWIAKAAIAELITRYAALNDAGEWEAVAALYTEDGRMSRPSAPDDFIVGRNAILAGFKARPHRAARHIVANVLVTLEPNGRAHATSQILLFGGSAADAGPPVQSTVPPMVGTYHDTLVLCEHAWRFVERRGTLDFRPPK
jgi:ketosteroid isomerase-like protein